MKKLTVFAGTRLSEEESKKLEHLARHAHRSKGSVLRHLLALAQVDDAGNIVLTPAGERR